MEEEAHQEQSILRRKLEIITAQIGCGGLIISSCTVVIMLVRFCLTRYSLQGEPFALFHLNYYIYFLIVGVTMLVVAVPVGLPLAVTLSLAYSSRHVSFFTNFKMTFIGFRWLKTTTWCATLITVRQWAIVRLFVSFKFRTVFTINYFQVRTRLAL